MPECKRAVPFGMALEIFVVINDSRDAHLAQGVAHKAA